jgi:hypothetical protein
MKGAARENRPPPGVEKSMLISDREKIGKIAEGLGRMVRSYRFALAAFLIPLFIRTIPEILVGPYPIGWDTIAFYVPNTLDWATGKTGWLTMLGTAPLMYMISVPIYMISHVNPVWIFKVMGPILYGSMILALFRFLTLRLKWPPKRALGATLLTTLYFVTLRISWDMYRIMLGSTFILLSLPLMEDFKNLKNQVTLATLIALAIAADQLTGVIALVLIGTRTLTAMMKRDWGSVSRLVGAALPSLLLFVSVAYASLIVPGTGLFQRQAVLPGFDSLSSSVGFLGYAYLALAPFILLGFGRVPNLDLKSWSGFCIGIVLLALVPFFGPIVASYRWSLLLDVPLCIYATAGFARLIQLTPIMVSRVSNVRKLAVPIVCTILAISAILYIAVPAQRAIPYYAAFPSLLPTSMIQDTVPLSEMVSLKQLLDWTATRLGPGTALITHQAIYGWARTYLPASNDHVVNYGYESALDGVQLARSTGFSSVLMIWWVNGTGWDGQPNVPAGFVPMVQEGSLAVYEYN